MPAVPLPLVSAAILLYLVIGSRLRGDRPGVVDAVLLLCAAQAVLVTLNLHVGLGWAARLQPLTGASIPPACHLAWIALAMRPLERADLWRHAIGPALVAAALLLSPSLVDLLLPALYAGYGSRLLGALRGGADGLPLARLEGGALSIRLWRAIGLVLIGSAASDVLISIAMIGGRAELAGWIVAAFTSVGLLALGALTLIRDESVGSDAAAPRTPDAERDETDASGSTSGLAPSAAPSAAQPLSDDEARDIVERVRALLVESALHTDPDLTIGRLARRLGLPVKRLSAAINRVEGRNVSQLVNGYRVEAACRELEHNGGRVTEAMLEAGFRTKSNFNREFRRVVGTSPTAWLGRAPGRR